MSLKYLSSKFADIVLGALAGVAEGGAGAVVDACALGGAFAGGGRGAAAFAFTAVDFFGGGGCGCGASGGVSLDDFTAVDFFGGGGCGSSGGVALAAFRKL